MDSLSKALSIEDLSVAALLNYGMPIVGKALESPYFEAYQGQEEMSVTELIRTAKERRAETVTHVLKCGRSMEKYVAAELFKASNKRVQKGRATGPLREKEVTAMLGEHWNAVGTFPREQGCRQDGSRKIRKISNHKRAKTTARMDGARQSKWPIRTPSCK